MSNRNDCVIPAALCREVTGQADWERLERLHPEVISQAMESRSVQTLEAIRCVLENGRLDDQDCCQRVDQLVQLFFQELGVQVERNRD